MFDLKDTEHRLEILQQLRTRLQRDAAVLERAKVKNGRVNKAIAKLRRELTEHCHQLDYAIKKRKRKNNAHNKSACS